MNRRNARDMLERRMIRGRELMDFTIMNNVSIAV
jgi:hypothetical protein